MRGPTAADTITNENAKNVQPLKQIEELLGGLSALFRRHVLREGGLWQAGALLLAVAGAVVLAHVGWLRAAFALLLLTAAASAVGWFIYLRRLRPIWDREINISAAQLAETLLPTLGSGPSSAVDLARQMQRDAVGFSRDLAASHIERTAEELSRAALTQRLAGSRKAPRQRALVALGTAFAVALLSLLVFDSGRNRLLAILRDPTAPYYSDTPLAADIRLVYHYPSYTALEKRTVEGGDGTMDAVVGTEVTIQATAVRDSESAFLMIEEDGVEAPRAVALQLEGGRKISGRLPILRDGRYRFGLVSDGDRLEERQQHAIRALPDEFPGIFMDQPAADVELKDDQSIDILWRSRDDYGIGEVYLVYEKDGDTEPTRIPLFAQGEVTKRREGRYRWTVADLGVEGGGQVRFYLEAVDNDTINGPKRSTSVARRLSLFSARGHHEAIMERQREFLDKLVDWLAADLTKPFAGDAAAYAKSIEQQRSLLAEMADTISFGQALVGDMRGDKLGKPEIATAFANIVEHLIEARGERGRLVDVAARSVGAPAAANLARAQRRAIAQLEKDIIYLDDLLAIQRIDELKHTAQDLLAAQRDLQNLLQKYKETQDPSLRAALEQQIRDLREKMLQLLAKMSQIKKHLPGEYRNMEAASMLQMDDQLERLEKMLNEGDLEAAAKELEQLANMIENMVDSIDSAEEEYGGERYAETRKQLAEFAEAFEQLERQQEALAKRSDDLLKKYRERAVKQAGKSLDELIKKVNKKAEDALKRLDTVADNPGAIDAALQEMAKARESLLDLEALMEARDFSEARKMAQQAERSAARMNSYLELYAKRPGQLARGPDVDEALENGEMAQKDTRDINAMLDKLFPDPQDILTPDERARMQRMQQKQQALQQQAGELGQKMDALAEQLPLFGGEPRANLDAAQGEMGEAGRALGEGQLPGAAAHKRRAAEQLKQLRQALQEASKGSGGGMPLPLGMGQGQGGRNGRQGNRIEDVEIPQQDPNRAGPKFREELLDAAKQKPPTRYEDAVRRYYEELIR